LQTINIIAPAVGQSTKWRVPHEASGSGGKLGASWVPGESFGLSISHIDDAGGLLISQLIGAQP